MSCGYEGEYCHEEELEAEILRLEAELKATKKALVASQRELRQIRRQVVRAVMPKEQPFVTPRSVPEPDR